MSIGREIANLFEGEEEVLEGEVVSEGGATPWLSLTRIRLEPYRVPVHPAAELFPLMEGESLQELASDIEQQGMTQPLVFWAKEEMPSFYGQRSQDEKRHAWIKKEAVLLDGRNRVEALRLLGYSDTKIVEQFPYRFVHGGDPHDLVLSYNVKRRHLTREQKRELIRKVLALKPEKTDRHVAKAVGVDHKTVGVVRREAESRGEIPHVGEREDSLGRRHKVGRREVPTRPPRARANIVKQLNQAREHLEDAESLDAVALSEIEDAHEQFGAALRVAKGRAA